MTLRSCLAGLFVGLTVFAGLARADEHDSPGAGRWWPFTGPRDVHRLIRCWCPDDYCVKKAPAAPCRTGCWLADDYCPKRLPCPPCRPPCGGPDDYVPKGCPIQVGVGGGPNYLCGRASAKPQAVVRQAGLISPLPAGSPGPASAPSPSRPSSAAAPAAAR